MLRLGELSRDRQAEPRAACSLVGIGSAMEWLEDLLALGRRDPRASVGHVNTSQSPSRFAVTATGDSLPLYASAFATRFESTRPE